RLQVSAPLGEIRDQLGADVTTTTYLGDGWSDPLGDLSQAVPVESEESDRILAQHQPELVFRYPNESVAQPVPGVRPCALRVREVTAEQHGLDTDFVSHLDLGLVDEGRPGQAVTVPVLARGALGRKFVVVLPEDLVEMAQGRRDPVQSNFGGHEPEVGMPV